MKRRIVFLLSMCMLLAACSDNEEIRQIDISVISSEEPTDVITETSEFFQTEAPVSETAEVQSDHSAETEAAADMTEELVSVTSRLMGALDYIDRIGGGSIPKDENDTIESDGRQYARVCAQFENTADLQQFITENLSDSLIQSRYSGILGGDQPYYIDVDGVLYGYVTAKGCGFPWILEDDKPIISITETGDGSFTAVTKFDNFGGECEMMLDIIFDDGFWKIASISYDGLTF